MINLQKIQKTFSTKIQSAAPVEKAVNAAQNITKEISDDTLKTYSKCIKSNYMPHIKNDSDKLSDIVEYGKKLRTKTEGKVSLDRNPLWDCNIPYQEKNYYRMIGEGGYEDIIKNGIIRPKQGTKCNYDVSYFETGRANAIYARKGGAKYILELPENCEKIIKKEGCYPMMLPAKTSETPHRIWQMAENRKYEVVYDSINDVITRHKDFKIS